MTRIPSSSAIGRAGSRRKSLRAVAVLGAGTLVLGLTACGSSRDSSASAPGSEGTINIAMFAAVSNSYHAEVVAGAMAEAEKLGGVKITVYDHKFDSATSVSQLNTVVALGKSKFQGVLLLPIDNNAIVPAAKKAIAAGIAVASANSVVGPKLDTTDIQVPGVVAQYASIWSSYGTRLGKLTVQACDGVDPCNVAFTKGLSNWAPETELRKTFATELGAHDNIKVVAQPGDTGYSREGGAKIIGALVQSNKDLSVIIGADQALTGASAVLKSANEPDGLKLIGYGGTKEAKAAILSGEWFGTIAQAPTDEGRLTLKGLVDYLRDGKKVGGFDSQVQILDDAIITKSNAASWTPQFSG